MSYGVDVRVRVEGAAQLRATMRRAGVDMADMKDANAAVATMVATSARGITPRASGRLAASVRGNRAAAKAVVKAGGAGLPYAGVQHWGWPRRHIRATYYVTEAAAATEPQWTDRYMTEVERIVNRITGA